MNKILPEQYFEVVGAEAVRGESCRPAASLRRIRRPVVSAVILACIVLGCVFCRLIMTHDPAYMDLLHYDTAPDRTFLFGTDSLGRDVFSMIWYGGRSSLIIGFLATLISTAIAVLYGTVSGILGGWADDVMMRFSEILMSIPSILLIIFTQAVIGRQSVTAIAVVIGVTGWMSVAKMIRTEVRRVRASEYVKLSRSMGGGFFHILRWHLAPNYVSSIMFMVVMNIRGAIVAESTLSFLGIGLPVETVSWGSMLSLSQKALLTHSWWVILIPGGFLVVTLMCITNIGNYIRQSLNHGESNL